MVGKVRKMVKKSKPINGMDGWMKHGRDGGGVLWEHLCGYSVITSPGKNPGDCGGCQ